MSLLFKLFSWILSSDDSVIYKYFQRTLYQHSFLWLSFITKALQIVVQWLVWMIINFDHLVHQIFFFITNHSTVGNLWRRFCNLFKSSLILASTCPERKQFIFIISTLASKMGQIKKDKGNKWLLGFFTHFWA